MATPDGNSTPFPNTIYQEVRDWTARQEAFEKENNAPAPLSEIQRAFLEDLRKALPALPSPAPLLDAGKDYVSLLHEYRSAKTPGNKINFVDGIHPSTNALGSPQWTCTVELSETSALEPSIKSFPAADYGFDASGCCPPFAKKKDAKQYAAKCAMDWLDKKSLLPAKRSSEGTSGVLSPPPKRKARGTTGTVDVNDDSLPATQRVSALCQSMGLRAPSYKLIHADSSLNYLYDGYPDFGDDEDSFGLPEGLGRITGVCGKDVARQEMAEQLLPHLLSMYRQRAADWESYSESLHP